MGLITLLILIKSNTDNSKINIIITTIIIIKIIKIMNIITIIIRMVAKTIAITKVIKNKENNKALWASSK